MAEINQQISEGWRIRQQNFHPILDCVYPTKTKSVSITGDWCGLQCKHCGGHYLKQMVPINKALHEPDDDCLSWLVSGGCNDQGRVPLKEYLSLLKKDKGNKKYNLHVGLPDINDIEDICAVADCVSLDFVADDSTIRQVYNLKRTVDDYLQAYRLLKSRVRVIPHICIGLYGGQLRGEYQALQQLEKMGAEKLVFIVFIPTRNTYFAKCSPPPLPEVINILARARQQFPNIPLHLGCMRPGGKYRRILDDYAVKAGINLVVQPTAKAVLTAQDLGLVLQRKEECCVF